MAGSPDVEIAKIAFESNAILITQDRGFAASIVRRQILSRGVVVLRLAALPRLTAIRMALNAIERYADQLAGAVTSVQPAFSRRRPLP